MILFGTKQRLCYSLWGIAAAIIVAINAMGFFSLEGQALEGYSPVIKSLQVNLARLDNALSMQRAIDVGDNEIQRLLAAYQLKKVPPAPEMTAVSDRGAAEKEIEISKEPTLPDLSGILLMVDQHGNHRYTALLDGKARQLNDRVNDFVVEKISPQGVVLSRSGKEWFVSCPNVYYSSDQGE